MSDNFTYSIAVVKLKNFSSLCCFMRKQRRFLSLMLGSLFILFGAAIAGKAEVGLGVTESSFFAAIFIAFIFIAIGGILWAPSSVKREEEMDC